MEVIMNTEQINDKLAFLHQYVKDLEGRDEKTGMDHELPLQFG